MRREVVGQIPSGGRVRILLHQPNPVLDYYLVRLLDMDQPQKGWLPAPFLAFEAPVAARESSWILYEAKMNRSRNP